MDKKTVVWFLAGMYLVPFVGKYVRAWKDRSLNE